MRALAEAVSAHREAMHMQLIGDFTKLNVDGKHLSDTVLQFVDDITPDGNMKDNFICRNCAWVAPNSDGHQEQQQG